MKKNENMTFNQIKNRMLNLKYWVNSNRNLISEVELKAFDLMCDDIMNHNCSIPFREFLEECYMQLRTWDLYKLYKEKNPNSHFRTERYFKKLSRINVAILLLNDCDNKPVLAHSLIKVLLDDKRKIKKIIEDIY